MSIYIILLFVAVFWISMLWVTMYAFVCELLPVLWWSLSWDMYCMKFFAGFSEFWGKVEVWVNGLTPRRPGPLETNFHWPFPDPSHPFLCPSIFSSILPCGFCAKEYQNMINDLCLHFTKVPQALCVRTGWDPPVTLVTERERSAPLQELPVHLVPWQHTEVKVGGLEAIHASYSILFL